MFMRGMIANVVFNHGAPCSGHITSVNDVQYNVRTVNDLEELAPNTFRLTLQEQVVLFLVAPVYVFALCALNVDIATPWYDSVSGIDRFVGIMARLCDLQELGVGIRLIRNARDGLFDNL